MGFMPELARIKRLRVGSLRRGQHRTPFPLPRMERGSGGEDQYRRGRRSYTANVFRTPAAYTFHGTTFRSSGNHVPRAPTRYRKPGSLLSTIWSTLRATCSAGMPPARDWPNFASMRLRVASYAATGRAAAGEASPIGVFTKPGSTRLTLTPNGRTSCHSDSEYPSTANFVAE